MSTPNPKCDYFSIYFPRTRHACLISIFEESCATDVSCAIEHISTSFRFHFHCDDDSILENNSNLFIYFYYFLMDCVHELLLVSHEISVWSVFFGATGIITVTWVAIDTTTKIWKNWNLPTGRALRQHALGQKTEKEVAFALTSAAVLSPP